MAAYCTPEDLTLGDMPLGAAIDRQEWVDRAASEMDARFGVTYVLPLPPTATFPAHIKEILRIANARLASGRLIMDAGIGGQAKELHAYGMYLIGEAYRDIDAIANGVLELPGVPRREDADVNRAPRVLNHDATSPVTAFEDFAMGGSLCPPQSWMPGG